MNRKDFISVALIAPTLLQEDVQAADACPQDFDFAQNWAKSMMRVLDSQLDETARRRIMQEQGRACFVHRHGPRKAAKDDLEKLLAGLGKWAGPEGLRRQGNVIEFTYPVKNGRCLCPLARSGPARLSGTFCQCSVGYVREMIERCAAGPLEVTLVDSLKTNRKPCKFRIELKS
jgi:hypothetical protein